MKTDPILYAVIGGSLVALTWAASAFAVSIRLEQVVGYGSVVVLLGMAASNYGVRLKKLFR